jgi:hypothetical protein
MNIEQIAKDVEEVIRAEKKQKVCPNINECKFIYDQIRICEMNTPGAHGYLTLVCEKYPDACKLNKQLAGIL